MIDFEQRLKSLKARRQSPETVTSFDGLRPILESYNANDFAKSEAYENLRESAGIKYAIGAMEPVSPRSTQISKDEGDRVANSLIKGLKDRGETAIKRLQGSVALDVHIKGHSDVDMLIIHHGTVNIELPSIARATYQPSTDSRGSVDIVKDLRTSSELILLKQFPQASVDCSSAKAISLEGGSLRRKVDIVPGIWFDSHRYQATHQESKRGVNIYDKANHKLILNYPFLHIENVNNKDAIYSGNLKCVTRLLKNIIADMPDAKKKIAKRLTSYDLAAIAYHMDDTLKVPTYMRLGLVEKVRRHLQWLLISADYRRSLKVPDETRHIFDEDNKVDGLEILLTEITDLANSINREINPYATGYKPETLLQKSIHV